MGHKPFPAANNSTVIIESCHIVCKQVTCFFIYRVQGATATAERNQGDEHCQLPPSLLLPPCSFGSNVTAEPPLLVRCRPIPLWQKLAFSSNASDGTSGGRPPPRADQEKGYLLQKDHGRNTAASCDVPWLPR